MLDADLKIQDNFQFSFALERHGWSTLTILHDDKAIPMCISAVFTHAPTEILTLCQAILENKPARIVLCSEPDGHIVELEPVPREQHTIILSISDVFYALSARNNTETGNLLLRLRTKRRQLLAMLMTELWMVHKFLAEKSFQRDREPNFPHTELRSLNAAWDKDEKLGPSFLR